MIGWIARYRAPLLAVCVLAAPAGLCAQDAGNAPAPIEHEAKLGVARQIVDLGFPEAMREAMFFATMEQVSMQLREASAKAFGVEDEGALAIIDQWAAEYLSSSKDILRAHIPSLMDGMAASYAAMFTDEELADILAFVSTSSGQRFFQLSSAVLAEPNFAAANQAYMNEVQAQLPAAQRELVARILAYKAESEENESSEPS